MATLRDARAQGRLDQFIAEREAGDPPPAGDADTLLRVVEAMARRPKVVPRSARWRRGDG